MWKALSIPLRVGIGFGIAGLALTLVGIVRGNVPNNPASMTVAILIGAGVWFLVAWAVATAAVDVEDDVRRSEQDAAQEM